MFCVTVNLKQSLYKPGEALCKDKSKANPLQAWTGPAVSSRPRLSDFNSRYTNVIILSALGTGRHEIFVVHNSVRGRFDPRYIVLSEGI